MAFLLLCSVASAATLNVGPKEKYKTIQSAVNVAHEGDTIKVAYGTYHEIVEINKSISIYGTKYPKVDGFSYDWGPSYKGGTINGFTILNHIYAKEFGIIIRNNYFTESSLNVIGPGDGDGITIINNQFPKGYIWLTYADKNVTITGNTISNTNYGLYCEHVEDFPTVTKNTFQNCGCAVYLDGFNKDPGRLSTFSGNKYIKNKQNIGWGNNN